MITATLRQEYPYVKDTPADFHQKMWAMSETVNVANNDCDFIFTSCVWRNGRIDTTVRACEPTGHLMGYNYVPTPDHDCDHLKAIRALGFEPIVPEGMGPVDPGVWPPGMGPDDV